MSYILDALRKADSERERGEIPGLHAQTAASLDDSAPTSSVNQKLVWAVAALAAVLVLVLSWLIWGRSETQPERPPMPPEHAAMSMRPAPPPTAPQVMAPPVTPPVAGLYPPVNTTPPVAQTQPVTAAPAVPTLQPQAVVAAPPQPKAEAPIAPIARKAAATEESKLYRLMDLPESVRKDLPTLTIGGAMYSDTASQRMLIINSQVLHEGDKISNDLTLESIQLKSAIFRFRTYRYVVNY